MKYELAERCAGKCLGVNAAYYFSRKVMAPRFVLAFR